MKYTSPGLDLATIPGFLFARHCLRGLNCAIMKYTFEHKEQLDGSQTRNLENEIHA